LGSLTPYVVFWGGGGSRRVARPGVVKSAISEYNPRGKIDRATGDAIIDITNPWPRDTRDGP
jgi:hypothetical protein